MKRYLVALLLLAAALAPVACGGKKRPPVIASAGVATPAPHHTPAAEPEPQPTAENVPDLRPLADESARSTDFGAFGASGEGGPLDDVHFEYDQATLTDQARAILDRHAAWLRGHRGARVRVEGHCDERGTVEYNLALGEQRARAVRDYLVALGVGAERLDVVSFGKERPLDPGNGEGAWARNRRAHFDVFL